MLRRPVESADSQHSALAGARTPAHRTVGWLGDDKTLHASFVLRTERRDDMSDRKPLPGKFAWFELVSKDAKKAQAF